MSAKNWLNGERFGLKIRKELHLEPEVTNYGKGCHMSKWASYHLDYSNRCWMTISQDCWWMARWIRHSWKTMSDRTRKSECINWAGSYWEHIQGRQFWGQMKVSDTSCPYDFVAQSSRSARLAPSWVPGRPICPIFLSLCYTAYLECPLLVQILFSKAQLESYLLSETSKFPSYLLSVVHTVGFT